MAAAAFAALGVKVQSLRKSPDAAADDVPPKCWATVSEDLGTALTVFHATVGSISRSITKLSLVGKMLPDEASAASICSELDELCEQLSSSALVAAHCGAGGPMRELYFKGANRILNATVEVAVSLSQQQWSDVPPATGKVWEACEAVAKLPKTPKAAYKRKLLAFCVELKVRFRAAYFHAGMNAGGTLITRLVSYAAQDQISEFNEKIEASSSKRAGDDAGDDADVGPDDFDALELDEAYDESELPCARRCVTLLRLVGTAHQLALGAMDACGAEGTAAPATGDDSQAEPAPQPQSLARVGSVFAACARLQGTGVRIAEGLYPPLESEELQSNLRSADAAAAELFDAISGDAPPAAPPTVTPASSPAPPSPPGGSKPANVPAAPQNPQDMQARWRREMDSCIAALSSLEDGEAR